MTRPRPGDPGPRAPVTLRRTRPGDLDRVLALETARDTLRWLGESSPDRHAAALADPDQEHLLVLGAGGIAGFVLLAAPRGTEPGVELRRIVVDPARRGRGLGRAALRAVVELVFGDRPAAPGSPGWLRAGRIWLDVKPDNHRALALYTGEGFARESELPASPGRPQGPPALLILARHRAPAAPPGPGPAAP